MSDAFLLGLDGVRPGLKSRSQKRKDRASEPSVTVSKRKKLQASEHEARTKGLATHISTENKGFSMLQKMGYKEGMGLGKSGKPLPVSWTYKPASLAYIPGAGVTTPIPLLLKEGESIPSLLIC